MMTRCATMGCLNEVTEGLVCDHHRGQVCEASKEFHREKQLARLKEVKEKIEALKKEAWELRLAIYNDGVDVQGTFGKWDGTIPTRAFRLERCLYHAQMDDIESIQVEKQQWSTKYRNGVEKCGVDFAITLVLTKEGSQRIGHREANFNLQEQTFGKVNVERNDDQN